MKNLSERQNKLKNKLENPLFEKKNVSNFFYVIIFLDGEKVFKISLTSSLKINFSASSNNLTVEIFPFTDFEIARAFEKRVRYFASKDQNNLKEEK